MGYEALPDKSFVYYVVPYQFFTYDPPRNLVLIIQERII